MASYTLSVVYPDGNPVKKACFGGDLRAAVEAMERRQEASGPTRTSGAHWMVWDAEDGEAGYFDRGDLDEAAAAQSTVAETRETVAQTLREIEQLAFNLRRTVAEAEVVETDRFDAALARLRAAKPRVEDLMGSGDPVDRLEVAPPEGHFVQRPWAPSWQGTASVLDLGREGQA